LASLSLQAGISKPTILAAELYCSAAFEASSRARFLTLCTALEVLSPRRKQPPAVVAQIDEWMAVARLKKSERTELDGDWKSIEGSLGRLKTQSITKSLRDKVLDIDNRPEANRSTRAVKLYAKRSVVVHCGGAVSDEELVDLEDIVRDLLIAAIAI
jgi:hypothetical protein